MSDEREAMIGSEIDAPRSENVGQASSKEGAPVGNEKDSKTSNKKDVTPSNEKNASTSYEKDAEASSGRNDIAKVEKKVKKQKPQSVKIRANKNLDEGEDDVSDSSVDMVVESEEEADWPQVEADESTLEELNSHYEVLCILEDGPEVSFLRKSEKVSGDFVFPIVPDLSVIENENVKMTLPKPTLFGQTKRQQSHFKFEIRFNNLDIR
ncbi:hypothetical protein FQA39_LY11092 [Lamprigera yunnana]|nr:hypothetical protein FQA39_LY11092 [Lamprigera yunnana]